MNPRDNQYALGRTLTGWSRLTSPTPRQVRTLRRAYSGWEPRVYSRYGRRQWAAPLSGTRLIVKDPFAMLALPTVVGATRAVPVVVHRHPAAVLASYRRMGWLPDLGEVRELVQVTREEHPDAALSDVPEVDPDSATGMAVFWRSLHELLLLDVERVPGLVVVAHDDVVGDAERCHRLLQRLGLHPTPATEADLAADGSRGTRDESALHNFSRSPREIAEGWRERVSVDEVSAMEELTAGVRERLSTIGFA